MREMSAACVQELRRELARTEAVALDPASNLTKWKPLAPSGCGDPMIKSVVVPRLVAREDELDRLQSVLTELGFKTGETWDDDRSRGLPLLAPLGALEFYHGQPPAPAEIIVEVDDVQQALQTLRSHGMKILAEVSRTHWGADMFVARIGGCCIAFFSWAEHAEAPHPKAA